MNNKGKIIYDITPEPESQDTRPDDKNQPQAAQDVRYVINEKKVFAQPRSESSGPYKKRSRKWPYLIVGLIVGTSVSIIGVSKLNEKTGRPMNASDKFAMPAITSTTNANTSTSNTGTVNPVTNGMTPINNESYQQSGNGDTETTVKPVPPNQVQQGNENVDAGAAPIQGGNSISDDTNDSSAKNNTLTDSDMAKLRKVLNIYSHILAGGNEHVQ